MNQLKNVFRTIILANLLALCTAGIIVAGDLTGQLPLQTAVSLVLFSLTVSSLVALFCSLFSYLFVCRERVLLSVLISLALAAVTVLNGNFAPDSWLPLAIYLVALLNSLLVASLVTAVSSETA